MNNELYHYGIKERSGRYPFGSGDRPYQHSINKLKAKREVNKQLRGSRRPIKYRSSQELQAELKRNKLENQYRKTQNAKLVSQKNLVDEANSLAGNIKTLNNKHQRNRNNKPIDLSGMSNKELSDAINRWNLEQNYTRMYNQKNINRGQYYTQQILDYAGDVLTIGSSALGIALAIKYLK
jgi:hypothetical protein